MRVALIAILMLLMAATAFAVGPEIGDVTVSPSAPAPGTAVALTFELKNPEKRALLPGVVSVRVSGRSIGVIATPAVPAGGRVRVSGGVTLPNVDDKSIRLELTPPGGSPLVTVLTLSPRATTPSATVAEPPMQPAPPAR